MSTCQTLRTAAVAQSVRSFASHAEGWVVFGFQLQLTLVVKTGSECSTAKRWATGLSVMGPQR